jgi:prevent-host-death family protein
MARPITVYETKTHLSRVLDEVEAGTEYVITRNGTPCARIVPLAKPGRVPLGFVHGEITDAFFEPLPEAELLAWEGEPKAPRRARRIKKLRGI